MKCPTRPFFIPRDIPYGTVQWPSVCQLAVPAAFSTQTKVDFAPAKAGLKVIVTVNVRLFPEPVSVEPLPLSVHWLFCSEADDPIGITLKLDPLSAAK